VLPWLYERHAIPAMGDRAQALIDSQAVDQADVVVAFFESGLGSGTGVDVSGTAEEIHRASEAGKPVHVCFSTRSLPRDAALDQVAALRKFKEELEQAGLLGEYGDPVDLAGRVDYAVQQDITDQGWAARLATTSRSGAQLRWRHDHEEEFKGNDKDGRAKYRTTANHLVVSNESDVAAEDLTFQVEPPRWRRSDLPSLRRPRGPYHASPPLRHAVAPHSVPQWHAAD